MVHGNPGDPGGKSRLKVKVADGLKRLDEHLLRDVFNIVPAPDQSLDDGKDPPLMAFDEETKRVAFAALNSANPLDFLINRLGSRAFHPATIIPVPHKHGRFRIAVGYRGDRSPGQPTDR